MDFWRPPKDVCVNRGPCYPKTEKKTNQKIALLPYRVYRLFRQTAKAAATAACFCRFGFIDNHNFLV